MPADIGRRRQYMRFMTAARTLRSVTRSNTVSVSNVVSIASTAPRSAVRSISRTVIAMVAPATAGA